MKPDSRFWRDAAVIVAVGLVVCSMFWLLLNTFYINDMPAVVRHWMPVFVFIVAVWQLIAHRLRNQPQEQAGQDSAAPPP
ncbi:hypothetical protein HF313_18155 [Massilia atriviolacea]|uniref:Uncharacterized protein n=1 Tax=Massilia atriviolacea TaxID=2495579 RepID=A0A430HTD2_9BURK|nr:hypothetical protein [Massilia atriviolacea]RSZ60791.1 hypothetical protein EJB06_01235 [Massilia atriviolacea]